MLNHRLQKLINVLHIKTNFFSKQIGFSQAYVSMLLSGKRLNPSERFYEAVFREFNVNTEWLRDGIGDMFCAQKKDNMISVSDSHLSDEAILKKYYLLSADDRAIIDEIIDAMILKRSGSNNTQALDK